MFRPSPDSKEEGDLLVLPSDRASLGFVSQKTKAATYWIMLRNVFHAIN